MKGAISGLLASALVLSAGARVARAEKPKKVIVEQFSGTGAEKFRKLVQAELSKEGIEVVADKKRAATEADLGLLQVSDNYAAVSKELGVGAFIDGTVTGSGKKHTARLKVKGPDGAALGSAGWTAANDKKLFGNIDDTLGKKLSGIWGGAKEEAEEAPAKEVAAAEEAPAPKKKAKKVAEESSDEKPAPVASGDAEATVSDSAEPSTSRGWKMIGLAVGVHVYGRNFSYNDSRAGGQQAYHLPAVPAPSLTLDWFFIRYVGLTLGGEYSVALISEDKNGDKYKTTSMGYFFGLKGRVFLGDTELTASLIPYAKNTFQVTPFADDPSPPEVAGVDYTQSKLGLGIRIPVGSVAIVGGATYIQLWGVGQLKEYFPGVTGRGGEGYAGIAFGLPVMQGLEARLTADLRRYAFAMNSIQDDLTGKEATGRVAGGAVDQYIGANITLGFRR